MLRLLAAGLLALAASPIFAQEAQDAGETATEQTAEPAAEPAAAAEANELPPFNVGVFKLTTTDDLVEVCALPEEHPDFITAHAFCIGFVTGTIHYHREIAAAPGMRSLICPGLPIPRDTLIEVFLAWAETHPGETQSNPVVSVIKAASDKWPCRG